MAVPGALVGVAAALGLGRLAASLLFELEGHDPLVIAAAALLLALVALGAGLVPAQRAASIDPMQALRSE
jgi:ABC-type antimicrobial peptide transport system permease subunit